ncbi:hypothetical protein A8B82_03910 [Sulfitobacter sp. EhC04]|uniref:CDP-alcohol phosphatidyltransferase family protein n=1 Tax=Sulfitobacter sp. EhC04 TaxID=1849168 RepID=UPI0007F48821|nr:phosphatidylcholine/phosphatidylserine synthase [Sulfitobacter sp. EhC04]OAN71450.1 hypothetical protein A8B82_03910 [Sulfitobacter sp. EhC04]
MTQRNRIKLRHVVPSIVTVFAICAGMTAIRMTLEGRLETGLAFVLLAVFLDAADGKLARFLDSASPFGAELDTLADFFNFGIVPGVLIYHTLYLGTPLASLGWLSILVLAVCCALRLARFNLSMRGPKVALKTDSYFVGIPAPALACLALMPVFMELYGWQNTDLPVLRSGYIICIGLLAISTVPTFSIKHATIHRAHLPFVMVAAVVLVVCLLVYPWPTLIVADCAYLLSLPFSYKAHKKHNKASPEHAYSAD